MVLRHPENETAAHLMTRAVATARGEESTSAVLARLEEGAYDTTEAVAILDEAGRYRGIVPLAALVTSPHVPCIDALIATHIMPARPELDGEQAAHLALEAETSVLPVVNVDGRFEGLLPSHTLLDILRREHSEDLQKLAGILPGADAARLAIETTPFARARARLPWLGLGLLGSLVAAAIVARFERTISDEIAVAFFMPAIVYLADAIGTQTEAAAVRGLSLSHRPLPRLLAGEVATGALLGGALALAALPIVAFGFDAPSLAGPVALAILVAGACASAIGLLLPWTLSRLGRDPAFGSGPIATVIQDVLSLLVYFVAVMALR